LISEVTEDTLLLYYKDKKVNALHGDIQIWMPETWWIHTQTLWKTRRIIFLHPTSRDTHYASSCHCHL